MRVQSQAVHPFDPDEVLGVGIGAPNPGRPEQRHVGVVYQVDPSGPRFCHLAWHFDLRDDPLRPEYLWGASGLHPINKTVLAAYVALLDQNARTVPYGIRYAGIYFDEQGKYISREPGQGLTCATFVLAVFEANGFRLLDTAHWPSRPADAAWHQQVLDDLAQHASPEHVDAAKLDIGAMRFRPEEVAAGVTASDIPLSFTVAEAIASEILGDIRAARGQT